MKVADDKIVRLERQFDGAMELEPREGGGIAYRPRLPSPRDVEHDARGLVVAIILCMICWASLGYFLLS